MSTSSTNQFALLGQRRFGAAAVVDRGAVLARGKAQVPAPVAAARVGGVAAAGVAAAVGQSQRRRPSSRRTSGASKNNWSGKASNCAMLSAATTS